MAHVRTALRAGAERLTDQRRVLVDALIDQDHPHAGQPVRGSGRRAPDRRGGHRAAASGRAGAVGTAAGAGSGAGGVGTRPPSGRLRLRQLPRTRGGVLPRRRSHPHAPVLAGVDALGLEPVRIQHDDPAIIVGAQALHATGYAMGMQFDGSDGAAITYFGDGATSQGDVSEAFVFAAIFCAPVVFFCQNNQWAISEPVSLQSPVSIAARGRGFGVPAVRVDGNDVLAVLTVTRAALERAQHDLRVVLQGASQAGVEGLAQRKGGRGGRGGHQWLPSRVSR